jgi:hypothetical protein
MSAVSLDTEGGVGTVTVDRPERYNALDSATLSALEGAPADACEEEVSAPVLAGAGEDAFSVGVDVREPADASVERAQRVTRDLSGFPAPTVAAVNGHYPGGGWELALNCDLRVAGERAVVGHTELDLAVVPPGAASGRSSGWSATKPHDCSSSSPNASTHRTPANSASSATSSPTSWPTTWRPSRPSRCRPQRRPSSTPGASGGPTSGSSGGPGGAVRRRHAARGDAEVPRRVVRPTAQADGSRPIPEVLPETRTDSRRSSRC